MKPSVLILIATYNVGGPGKGIFQYLTQLNKSEFDYVVVNFLKKNDQESEFISEAKHNNINLEIVKQKYAFDISMLVQVYKIFKKYNCNIIQSHGYKGHFISLIISKIAKIKWIAFVHGWTNEDWKIKAYNYLDLKLLKYPDMAIAVSPDLFTNLKRIRNRRKKTELILNAVDTKELERKSRGEKFQFKKINDKNICLGVIGRFSPEKGHEILIKALHQVLKKRNDFEVIMIGDGPEMNKIVDLANHYGLNNKITFIGYQSNIYDYYKLIDLLILPSLSEGLPNVVLEAMALGTPVLSTDVGGVSEIIKNEFNGWLVQANNIDALAQKILFVMKDKSQLKQYGQVAKNSIYPKFMPNVRATNIINIYNNILNCDE